MSIQEDEFDKQLITLKNFYRNGYMIHKHKDSLSKDISNCIKLCNSYGRARKMQFFKENLSKVDNYLETYIPSYDILVDKILKEYSNHKERQLLLISLIDNLITVKEHCSKEINDREFIQRYLSTKVELIKNNIKNYKESFLLTNRLLSTINNEVRENLFKAELNADVFVNDSQIIQPHNSDDNEDTFEKYFNEYPNKDIKDTMKKYYKEDFTSSQVGYYIDELNNDLLSKNITSDDKKIRKIAQIIDVNTFMSLFLSDTFIKHSIKYLKNIEIKNITEKNVILSFILNNINHEGYQKILITELTHSFSNIK